MEDGRAIRSLGLIERLERELGEPGRDDSFYWYFHLKKLGKQAQTEEMVEEAVNSVVVNDHQPPAFIKYEPIELETPKFTDKDNAISNAEDAYVYDLTAVEGPVDTIYYITDIHLEHQLTNDPSDILKLSLSEIEQRIDDKLSELLESQRLIEYSDNCGILLVGGDVANSIEMESLFYKHLRNKWSDRIIAVLGNHELWDWPNPARLPALPPVVLPPARPIDEIIADYRKNMPGICLLENQLLICYKGILYKILDEQMILDASVEELGEVCANSTFLLLGGIGFSGLNPYYNAQLGLYRTTVSTEEDIARSRRFRTVYEKVLASAENLRVIVLSHTQKEDWSDARYNPNWIYVSGHTHQNVFLLQDDGVAVFSDNQVGYKPKPWRLKGFTIDTHKYDPFKDYSDGVHPITREQYADFNRCQGINTKGMKCPGDLYALKRDGIYMFVLQNAGALYLLEGGKPRKLDYSIDYYYDNLPEYIRKVRGAFAPCQKALSMISDEVRAIGGSGKIHGLIVDIDYFRHIYLNPLDGKVTLYFAMDKTYKVAYDGDIESFLKTVSDSMRVRYLAMAEAGKLPVLSQYANKEWKSAAVPQIVLDRSIYDLSDVMRSVQYIFDQNVLRVWSNAFFSIQDSNNALAGVEKTLNLNND